MTKNEFLTDLKRKLKPMEKGEIQKTLDYYAEMIDDRMDEGMTEQEAVNDIGSVHDIAKELLLNTGLLTLVKAKVKPERKLRAWEIALIVMAAPIWLPIAAVLTGVMLVAYIVMWVVCIALWAGTVAITVSGAGGVIAWGLFLGTNMPFAFFILGCAFVCCGLGILAIFGMKRFTVLWAKLTVSLTKGIKSLFIKGEKK